MNPTSQPLTHLVLNPTLTIPPSPSQVSTSGPSHLLFLLSESPIPSSSASFNPDCLGSNSQPPFYCPLTLANGLTSLVSTQFPHL